jgi:FkbM family methyltransferase
MIMKRYSQLGQDEWVYSYIGRSGYAVEVGAFDGVENSNTLGLEQLGWKCLLIEPVAESAAKCRVNRPQAKVYEECAAAEVGMVEFMACNNGQLSGISEHLHKYRDVVENNSSRRMIPSRPLADILDEAGAPKTIQYLSLDTEGSEYEILRVFPFDRYEFEVITVEHNHVEPQRTQIRDLLVSNMYRLAKSVKCDDYYVHM